MALMELQERQDVADFGACWVMGEHQKSMYIQLYIYINIYIYKIIPTDFHILFFSGVESTNQISIYIYDMYIYIYLVGGDWNHGILNDFPFSIFCWEFHHPN
jgi:hypothetical protein